MATKTLTITEEAYNALKNMKMNKESFSKTVLRIARQRKGFPEQYFGMWKNNPEFARRVTEQRKAANKDAEERRRRFERMRK